MRPGRAALRDSKAHPTPPRFARRLRRKGRHGLPGKPDSRHRGLLPHRWGKPVTNRSNQLGDALGIAGEAKRSPRAYALTIASIATRRVLIAGSPPWGRRPVRRRQIDRTEGRVHVGDAQFVGHRPRGEMRKPRSPRARHIPRLPRPACRSASEELGHAPGRVRRRRRPHHRAHRPAERRRGTPTRPNSSSKSLSGGAHTRTSGPSARRLRPCKGEQTASLCIAGRASVCR
jgi:hypothetical protein